ncbi:MAG: response regulator [Minwuia sp.]|nr:response regulator [Minwuia sp.]
MTFLLVEDDEVDVLAMQRSFRALKIANTLVVARNGLEALDLLRGENGAAPISRPYIVLLDLNMPQMNGIEFLDVVRQDPELNTMVVFVLTTSNDDQDRVAAYSRHVAGYIVKAQPEDTLPKAIEMLTHYWRIVELP